MTDVSLSEIDELIGVLREVEGMLFHFSSAMKGCGERVPEKDSLLRPTFYKMGSLAIGMSITSGMYASCMQSLRDSLESKSSKTLIKGSERSGVH